MCCALLALTIGLVVGFAVASIVCGSDKDEGGQC